MGVSLALRWAIRHPDRVVRVVGWGAPIYPSPSAARQQIAGSAMAKLFALDTHVAERACAVSCRHRAAAGWLSAVAEPRLPVAIARQVPLHTWPAYRDAVRHLLEDDRTVTVGDLGRHLDTAIDRTGVHDDGVGLRVAHTSSASVPDRTTTASTSTQTATRCAF